MTTIREYIDEAMNIVEDSFLTEKNEVKRALFGDYRHKIKTFGIMTAENPMGNELTPEENNKRTEELKNYCSKIHCQYIPIKGYFDVGGTKVSDKNYGDNKYGKSNRRPEHSFLIINITLNELKYLCDKFEQLSFFFGENYWGINPNNEVDSDTINSTDRHTSSALSYYEKKNINSEYKLIETSRKIENAKDFDNFFSRHGNFDYSIYMKIFNESYDSIKEVLDYDCLEEALDETKTDRHRVMRRAFAYNGKLK